MKPVDSQRPTRRWRVLACAAFTGVAVAAVLYFFSSFRPASAPAVHPASAIVPKYYGMAETPPKPHVTPLSERHVRLSAMATLGKQIFFDQTLSGSGRLSCASCHSPEHAFGPPDGQSVRLGGLSGRDEGQRAVPSLRYLEHNPSFSIGPTTAMPDTDVPVGAPAAVSGTVAGSAKSGPPQAATAPVPQGGFDWDGRANTLEEQASGPFLDPHEMANRSLDALAEKLELRPYAESFRQLFGPQIFSDRDQAMNEALFALGRYQAEDPAFHPYDSKYDWYVAGEVPLTAQEMRGLKLFDDPAKGNCSSCHIDKPSRDGIFPAAFTDYQFEALGVPRNRQLAINRDPHHFDMGLCGPTRADYLHQANYCGLFKTPTLRNAASRGVFFHNGLFHSLDQVMHWYVERDTDSRKWYPVRKDGTIDRYDDLPARYRVNVDHVDAPLDRKPGEAPALNDAEIADVIAFLKTLDDGYRKP
jgi:cytochrome c peroxidase